MTDDSLVPDNNNQLSSSSSFSVCTSSSHESAIEPLSASPQSSHCPEMMMMLNHTHPDHIDHHHFPSLNPKAITSPSSSSHSPTSAHIRPLSDLVPNSVIHNGDQFGPVPNMYKWLHHQIARLEQHHNKSPSSSPQRVTSTDQPNQMVDIAMSKEEQNLEIIYQNGEYYFEAIHSFRVRTFDSKGKTKLESISYCDVPSKACKAWLAKEIESKLVLKPGKSWLNGTETYYCLMCNLFSPHSNLILLHMILSCSKLNSQNASLQTEDIQNYSPPKDANNNNNSNGVKLYSPSKAPRRSFDIMSLLNRTNSDPTPEFTRISSDDNISDEDDSDEKIDVETLEDDHDESRMHFGTLLRPIGAEGAMRSAVTFDSFGGMMPNGNVPRKSANRSNTRQPRAPKAQNSIFAGSYPTMSNKPVKNARQTNLTRQPKSAFKKPKVSEHVNLDLIGTNGKRGPVSENLVPNMMVPNLANLYSQFGSSLFANTFASFFNQSNQSTHQSSASIPNSSSMLGPVMDHAFGSNYGSSSSLFPPTGNHLGSLGSLRNSASLEPNSPPKFINSNLSPSKLPSPAGASPYPSGSTHPRFDMLNHHPNQASPSLSNGPSSIMTSSSLASNSPGSLSDSSSTTTSSSISPTSLVSISPKSHSNHDFDHKSSANRGSDHKEPKSRKGHRTQSPTSPTVSPPNGLNLPPYFMPPSTTASSTAPLLSSMYLLSPSLTALSYQAGNVCAYCNTTFRMTSDLVYHMRSHHKSAIGPRDTNSGKNKRRNDALKCNICQETFRERHHLTRHMTSHQ